MSRLSNILRHVALLGFPLLCISQSTASVRKYIIKQWKFIMSQNFVLKLTHTQPPTQTDLRGILYPEVGMRGELVHRPHTMNFTVDLL